MKTQADLNFTLVPMKKVLIALDYNPTAHQIAEVGYSLANSLGADVVLLHVISDISYYSMPQDPIMGFGGFSSANFYEKVDIHGLEHASEYYLESLKSHLGDDSITIITAMGDYASTILNVAEDEGVDLIVIGSHNRSWLEEVMVGSVSKDVLSKTHIPMFVVPVKELK